jgi:hypothetical protein
VPEGSRRNGTGIRSSRTHAYAVCGCTPTDRAHAGQLHANIHSLTNTHIHKRFAEQFATPDSPHRARLLTPKGTRSMNYGELNGLRDYYDNTDVAGEFADAELETP